MLYLLHVLTCGGLLLLAFLVFTTHKGANRSANQWMGVFLFSLACLILDDSFFHYKVYLQYPHLLGFTDILIFAIAPSLFLGVTYFVSPGRVFECVEWLHFLPTLLFVLLEIPFFLLDAATKRQEVTYRIYHPTTTDPMQVFLLGVLFLQITIYWFLAYKKLLHHQKNVHIFASSIEPIALNWLKYFLWSLIFMILIWIGDVFNLWGLAAYAPIVYFIGVYILGYFILKQREIFPFALKERIEIKTIIDASNKKIAEKREVFDPIQLKKLKAKLLQVMQHQKPHLDNELSLPKLAASMNMSVHELSYLLNEGFEENFFQFVNRHRVEEAKQLIKNPKFDHLSMMGIAYEAGFNSKTTFNTAFKKMVGCSPTTFRQKSDP